MNNALKMLLLEQHLGGHLRKYLLLLIRKLHVNLLVMAGMEHV